MRQLLIMSAITATAALALSACGSSGGTAETSASAAGTPAGQPPPAAAVARTLGATGFTDCGPAPAGGVTDSGTAYLSGKRIGIDTFPGADIRDRWEQAARNAGVVPFRQTAQWVVYDSVAQHAKGCA